MKDDSPFRLMLAGWEPTINSGLRFCGHRHQSLHHTDIFVKDLQKNPNFIMVDKSYTVLILVKTENVLNIYK